MPTFLSYRFVEEPIRHRQYLPRRGAMATVAIACIAVPCLAGAALVSAWRDAWWHPDVAELVRTTTMAHRDVVEGCTDVSGVGPGSGSCHFAAPGATRTVLLIGDSNAGMYVEPMLEAAKAHNVDLEVATRNGCPFVAAPRAGNAACRDFVRSSIAAISTRQPPYAAVVVVNSGKYPLSNPAAFAELAPSNGSKEEERGIAGFAAALAAMVDRVSAHSPVVLIESIPQASGKRFPRCLMPSLLAPLQTDCARFDAAFLEANRTRLLKAVRAAVGDRAVLFDPAARLCSGDGTCSMFMGDRLVYRDESHLSVSGSLEFTGDLTAVLEQVLERPSPAR